MSSIWVFFLDRSGRWESHSNRPLRLLMIRSLKSGRWQSKLEAAKDVLTRQAARINPQQEMAIIAFDGSYREVYHGPVSSFDRSFLDPIEPGSNTNLSGAVDAITSNAKYRRYASIHVLLISDGLYPTT